MIKDFIKDKLSKMTFWQFLKSIGRNKEIKDLIVVATTSLSTSANLSQRIYHLINVNIRDTCLICNMPTKYRTFYLGYSRYCGAKCQMRDKDQLNKIKKTCLERYGVDNSSKNSQIQGKIKKTNLERYGVECSLQSQKIKNKIKKTNLEKYGSEYIGGSEIIKEKIKKTNLERYDVKYPFQNKDIQDKVKETHFLKYGGNPFSNNEVQDKIKKFNLNKYGVEYVLSSNIIWDKIKKTNLERYGSEHISQSQKIKDKNRQRFFNAIKSNPKFYLKQVKPIFSEKEYHGIDHINYYPFECLICKNIFYGYIDNGNIPRCSFCFPFSHSKGEVQLRQWLKELNIKEIITNKRTIIPPLELDGFLPDYNLAIEFNGLFWHSELSGKDKHYHLDKTKKCIEKGIHLIHVFEDEWINKQDIVKSIILNRLGLIKTKIFARDCEIKEVSRDESLTFLSLNHLQEPIAGKLNFGLYFNNELVQLISLSKPRFNKNFDFELLRSCSKINTVVVGGFDKLIKNCGLHNIISYVDRRYFTGKGYKNWKYCGETSPNYYYTNDYQIRESRLKYQKHKLKFLFPEIHDPNLTEWQIMQLAGYDRIWDCGNLVYVYK